MTQEEREAIYSALALLAREIDNSKNWEVVYSTQEKLLPMIDFLLTPDKKDHP